MSTTIRAALATLLTGVAAAAPEIPIPVWAHALLGAALVALAVPLRVTLSPESTLAADAYVPPAAPGQATGGTP